MLDFLQILTSGVLVGATYALIALGFSLVYRVTGVINLVQGAFCIIAALIAWSLQTQLRLPALVAAPAAVLVTTLLGVITGSLTFVPGLAKLSNANMLMLTVGLLTLAEGVILVTWGSQPYALQPFTGDKPLDIGGILVPTQGLWVLGAAIVIILGLWYLLSKTFLGQALRACAENPVAARLMGIDVRRMAIFAFGLASAIGAVAGVVVAPTTSLEFGSGRLFTFYGFIAVAIGGIGSFPGSIAGGVLLGLLQQFATAYVSSLFSSAIALFVLLIMLVLKPSGLVGSKVQRRQDVRDEARVAAHITRMTPATSRIGGVIVALLVLALPLVVQSQAILSSLVIAGILFIALIGLDIVMGYAGLVNLGQAGFMAVGGYTAGYIVTQFGWVPPIVAIAVGILASIVIACLLSLVTMRLRGLYLALATLSFSLLVDAFTIGLVDITGGPSGLVGIPSFSIGHYVFDAPPKMYYVVVIIDIALVVGLYGAMRTGFGRALQSIRTDQMASAALGINVKGIKMLALAISAALGALSGGLYAFFFNFLSPEMVGTQQSLSLVAMLVLGGEGTLVGPVLGSLLLTLLPTVFQPLALYKTLASGLLLVLCFLFMPQGLFGLAIHKLNSRSHRKPTKAASSRLSKEPMS